MGISLDPISALIGGGISAVTSLWEGDQNRKAADAAARRNLLAQYDFAQHGIQWKVQDALTAGINPLAALGASTSSFSNVAGDVPSLGIGKAGDAMGRAVKEAFAEKDEIETEYKRAQIDYLKSLTIKNLAPGTAPKINPAQLVDGQSEGEHSSVWGGGSAAPIKVKPFELTPGSVSNPNWMPGRNPEIELGISSGEGDVARIIGDKSMRSNDIIGPLQWHVRNTVLPGLNAVRDYVENVPRKREWMTLPQKPGYQILFNPLTGREFYQKLWSGKWGSR